MRNYFTFAGADSRDFGVYISGSGAFSAPARAYEMLTIPGRNGDLIGDEKRLENMELTYPAFMYANFRESLQAFRSFLLSQVGYKRLEDSYHPEEYRMACFVGPLEPEVLTDNKAGSFDVVFTCKPQRFLLTGEQAVVYTGNGNIWNPTLFDAQPLIRVYGAGRVGIGSNAITIASNPLPYIDIDCAMMDAYNGATNCNGYISIQNNDFPVLPAGITGITLSGVTRVEITPRWWQL